MVDQMSVDAGRFVEVLRLLSMEAEEQRSVLPRFVDVPDELALLFGDQRDLLVGDELALALGAEAIDLVDQIEVLFRHMAGKPEYYSMQALRERAEWLSIRRLSREALKAAGVAPQVPRLDWITYVQGGERRG